MIKIKLLRCNKTKSWNVNHPWVQAWQNNWDCSIVRRTKYRKSWINSKVYSHSWTNNQMGSKRKVWF
jgi:hypothetical protein